MSGSPQSSQATLTQYDRLLAAWSDQSAGVHSKTARLLPNTTNTAVGLGERRSAGSTDPATSADSNGVRLLMTAVLIWCAMSVPVALAVARMLAGAAGGHPPNPPIVRPAQNQLVRG